MKKALCLITGFCWGIFVSNKEILWYAVIVSLITLLIVLLCDDKETE